MKYPHTFDDYSLSRIMSSIAVLPTCCLAAFQNSYFASGSKRAKNNILEQVDTGCKNPRMTFRQVEAPPTPAKEGDDPESHSSR